MVPVPDRKMRRMRFGRPGWQAAPFLLLATTLLYACGGDKPPPTGPGEDPQRVTAVTVTPDTANLVPNETRQLQVSVTDQNGNALSGKTVTWRSSNSVVASVESTGLVTGVSAGSVTVTATVEGQSGSAAVTVAAERISDAATIIDSTEASLVSDSTERAAGLFKFVVTGTAPTIQIDDVILGPQDGGFLRRVTSVSSAGDTIIVRTSDDADLTDVVDAGSFQTTVTVDLSATNASPTIHGDVQWGAPRITYLAPGGVVTGDGLTFDELELINKEVCINAVCVDVRLAFEDLLIDFKPTFDLGAEIGFPKLLKELHAIVGGALTLNSNVAFSATGAFAAEDDMVVIGVSVPFSAVTLPVWGTIELLLKVGFSANAAGDIAFQTGFISTAPVQVGGRYDGSDWATVFDASVDARTHGETTASGAARGEVRVFVRPEIAVIVFGVAGGFIGVEPYGRVEGSIGADRWTLEGTMGLDAVGGLRLTVFKLTLAELPLSLEGPSVPFLNLSGSIVDSIKISPPRASLAIGQTQEYSAAAYSKGGRVPWPEGTAVTWSSSDTSVASIVPTSDSTALGAALDSGSVQITVSLGGVTSSPAATLEVIALVAKPSGAVVIADLTNVTAGSATANIDVVVLDENGNKISGIGQSAYTISDILFGGGTLSLTATSATPTTSPYSGAFSAALVVDQSGSMSSNDPTEARYTAVKQFTREMTSQDEAVLYTFSSASNIQRHTTFTSEPDGLDDAVDALPSPSGQTALYDAGLVACSYVQTNAMNTNRVVVLLTDGRDNDSRTSLDDLIAGCNNVGVKIFTLGFSSARLDELARIAAETRGVAFYDQDVDALLSAFRGAPKILRGNTVPDRVIFSVLSSNAALGNGGSFSGTVNVDLGPGRSVSAPFFVSWPAAGCSVGTVSINYGDTETGCITSAGEVNGYQFDASAGDGIMVEARRTGGNLDLFTTLSPINGSTIGGDRDALDNGGEWIATVSSESGSKTIQVQSVAGTSGSYQITLQRCRVVASSINSTVSDALVQSDCALDGSFYGFHVTFTGNSGQAVQLDLSSSWDNFLILVGPDGAIVDTDDDSGPGLNARIIATLPSTGTYVAFPTSFAPGVTGALTLTLSSSAPSVAVRLRNLEMSPASEWKPVPRQLPVKRRGRQ